MRGCARSGPPRTRPLARRRGISLAARRGRTQCPTRYPTLVRKTSVYLDDADARRLARLAELEGVSQATVLRKAIRAYVPAPRGARTFALDGVGDGPGTSIADVDDCELLAGFGE